MKDGMDSGMPYHLRFDKGPWSEKDSSKSMRELTEPEAKTLFEKLSK